MLWDLALNHSVYTQNSYYARPHDFYGDSGTQLQCDVSAHFRNLLSLVSPHNNLLVPPESHSRDMNILGSFDRRLDSSKDRFKRQLCFQPMGVASRPFPRPGYHFLTHFILKFDVLVLRISSPPAALLFTPQTNL